MTIFFAVFKNEQLYIQPARDFHVTVQGLVKGDYEINVGPRFRPHFIADLNEHLAEAPNYAGDSFLDFYSVEATQYAVFLYNYLVRAGLKNEISRYYPLTAFREDTLAAEGADANDPNSLYLSPENADGGRFIVKNGVKTFFWMKITHGYRAMINNDFSKLETEWPRIEQGEAIPKNSAKKYDTTGRLAYTLYIPIFSIEPVNGGRMEIEYFDCGSIRYFSDNFFDKQEGWELDLNGVDLAFDYSKVSGFYRT